VLEDSLFKTVELVAPRGDDFDPAADEVSGRRDSLPSEFSDTDDLGL